MFYATRESALYALGLLNQGISRLGGKERSLSIDRLNISKHRADNTKFLANFGSLWATKFLYDRAAQVCNKPLMLGICALNFFLERLLTQPVVGRPRSIESDGAEERASEKPGMVEDKTVTISDRAQEFIKSLKAKLGKMDYTQDAIKALSLSVAVVYLIPRFLGERGSEVLLKALYLTTFIVANTLGLSAFFLPMIFGRRKGTSS